MARGDPRPVGELAPGLHAAGFDLAGALSAARYDALVPPAWRTADLLPDARAAIVVASGGRALWDAFRIAPEFALARDPLDTYTRRVLEAAAPRLAEGTRALFAFERRGGRYADFVALGRAAGLGAPSRLGLLLHPEYGPWMSIRAVLLTRAELPENGPLEAFEPCDGCPAPCATACHGSALPPAGFDVAACVATRPGEPACRLRCDARRACVVGREHVYPEEAESHHMRALDAF